MDNGDGKDPIRVVRVLEYVGPRDVVLRTLHKSIQGRLDVPGGMMITALELDRAEAQHALVVDAVDMVLAEARQQRDTRRPARAELMAPPYHGQPRQYGCHACTQAEGTPVTHPYGIPCPQALPPQWACVACTMGSERARADDPPVTHPMGEKCPVFGFAVDGTR